MNLAKRDLRLIILTFHIFQATTVTTTSSSKTLVASNKSQQSLSGCFDNPGSYYSRGIKCSESGPLLQYFHCATYNENTKILSFIRCPYFQWSVYNIITTGYFCACHGYFPLLFLLNTIIYRFNLARDIYLIREHQLSAWSWRQINNAKSN